MGTDNLATTHTWQQNNNASVMSIQWQHLYVTAE